jgi:hypothetical protein
MTRYSAANAKATDPEALSGDKQTAAQIGFPSEKHGMTLADSARKDLEATLQLLADRAQYISGGTGAAIALRDGDHVLCRASSGISAPRTGSYLELGSGLSGESVRTRTTLRCDDAENDPRVDKETCRQVGIASFAVMPIIRENEVVGIFEIFAGKPRAFEERDMVALQRLGELVNTALDHASTGPSESLGFALHGSAFKAQIANAAAEITPKKRTRVTLATPAGAAAAAKPQALGIHFCSRCGFPVSHDRTLCLDCEAKDSSEAEPAPAFLSAPVPPSGAKQWILRNRYIIGMILISAATIVFIVLR